MSCVMWVSNRRSISTAPAALRSQGHADDGSGEWPATAARPDPDDRRGRAETPLEGDVRAAGRSAAAGLRVLVADRLWTVPHPGRRAPAGRGWPAGPRA